MRIVVAVKILPDSKDLRAGNDGALDFSHARNVVSEYDLNAIEAAAQLAASQEGSTVKVLSVGPASIDESKVKKNILSRGVDELYFATNDALEHADARATAQALSLALQDVGGWDVVICGDGSDDCHHQQHGNDKAFAHGYLRKFKMSCSMSFLQYSAFKRVFLHTIGIFVLFLRKLWRR